ncbi:[NiFe] hydrogenase metallocenter assembly protein HypD [Raoultella ornithinolytica]|nr:[NiFe] hydrogenase metallocenter assembly protein HypD [Raoultella ornithinolytica]
MRFVDEYRAPEQVMQLVEHLQARAHLLPHTAGASAAHYGSVRRPYATPSLNSVSTSCCRRISNLFTAPAARSAFLPMGRIDTCIDIASPPGGVFSAPSATPCACPAKTAPCCRRKSRGADVRIVYSPMDAPEGWRSRTRSGRWSSLASVLKPTMPATALTPASGPRAQRG